VLPSAHVLDDFWLDLLLGQVQGKDRFLPGDLKPLQIQFGQFQKIARRGKRSAGQKQMQMRMPMQQLAVSLDGRDHASHDVVATQKPPDFCLDAGPGTVREFSQQAAVEASVESQTLGNRQHNLPVRDRGANFFGYVQCGQ